MDPVRQAGRGDRREQLDTHRRLWRADDPSEAGRATDVGFRAGRFGRFEWEQDGEGYYVQFLPPHMDDMSAPPEGMLAEMNYAGVETVVLQNDHIYGNLAEYFAEAARRWPGRFIGLAQVDEPFAYRDEELQALEDQVQRLGMRGLYFTMTGFFRNGYGTLPDDPAFDPLWRAVSRRDLPVFWVHAAKSPAGDYLDEMRRLRRIIDRHPTVRHVLVHGVPTALYADEKDRVVWPEAIADLLGQRPVWSEVLYPIAWGPHAVPLRAGAGALPSNVRAIRGRQVPLGVGHAERRPLLHLSPGARVPVGPCGLPAGGRPPPYLQGEHARAAGTRSIKLSPSVGLPEGEDNRPPTRLASRPSFTVHARVTATSPPSASLLPHEESDHARGDGDDADC